MLRYFFAVDFGTRRCHDRDGIDLTSVDHVTTDVSGLLLDLAHSDRPMMGRIISVEVNNASGAVIDRVTMTIDGPRA